MKKYALYLSCTALLAASFCLIPNANRAQSTGDQSPSTHALVQPDSIQWKPFFPGAEIAAISGDPAKEGEPFVLRIKLPDGMKVPPHWHPVDENITVLKGTFLVGMGEKYETSSMKPLPVGGFGLLPKKMPHFAYSKGETIVQVHGTGPFQVIFVNPADDPRQKSTPK